MKVLFVATGVFLKGGIERYTRYQYRALQKQYGVDNVFLASLLGHSESNSFEEDIDVHYVQGGISLKDKVLYLIKCLFLIRELRIDLVLCNHRQLSIIGYIASKIFGVKFITNVYGLEIWSGMNKVETHALFKSDMIVGDCNFIIDYIKEHFEYPSSQIELLYDAVDIDRFFPKPKNDKLARKYNIPNNKFIVATIGRLARNKGHEIIIRALKELNDSIIYLIVGGGKMESSLKELCMELNLEDRVIFTGRVPEDELADCYNIADVIVLLSVFGNNEGEGLPLGLIEASACGKPIICGNQDGSVDAISQKAPNGFCIDPSSNAQICTAINAYFQDRQKAEAHGTNGKTYVIENFEYGIFEKKQNQIIESVMSH